ncbi:preprotein translocase subunit YajC [Corynebacterium flavescens]|uniref:preprotein translocase subunit YajC n=1 Tax=Corynebacterium flavescens TaxID=28028 RepID=UPI003FD2A1C7
MGESQTGLINTSGKLDPHGIIWNWNFFVIALAALLLLQAVFMMRKQKQQRGKMMDYQAALSVGQKVITVGGMHGTVVRANEGSVDLEVAPGTVITFDKLAIARDQSAVAAASHPEVEPESPSNTSEAVQQDSSENESAPRDRD